MTLSQNKTSSSSFRNIQAFLTSIFQVFICMHGKPIAMMNLSSNRFYLGSKAMHKNSSYRVSNLFTWNILGQPFSF